MAKDIKNIEIITNELYVKNKYDKTTSYLKDLEIRKLKLLNNTILNYDKEDGFSKVDDLNIDVQLLNQKYNDDIKIVIDDKFVMNEYEGLRPNKYCLK